MVNLVNLTRIDFAVASQQRLNPRRPPALTREGPPAHIAGGPEDAKITGQSDRDPRRAGARSIPSSPILMRGRRSVSARASRASPKSCSKGPGLDQWSRAGRAHNGGHRKLRRALGNAARRGHALATPHAAARWRG